MNGIPMKSTTSKTNPKYYNYIGIGLILAIGLVLFAGYYIRQKKLHEIVYLEAKPIQGPYGWGYDIVANGKVYIHQEFIPAIPGKKGFASKEQAVAVGNKVILKMRNKQIPPTLSIEELKDLGVIQDSFVRK